MNLLDLLSRDRILCGAQAASKKRALEIASKLVAETLDGSLNQGEVFDSLIARERLGSTGLGHGVAIPHGRLVALNEPSLAVVQLAHAIDYDASDREPVDLVFALLVPKNATEEHLQILGQLAEMLHDAALRDALRTAPSAQELFTVVEHWTHTRQADPS